MTAPAIAVEAPEGAHWAYEEVKTNRGEDSLGDVPMLRWDILDGAVEHYGEDAIIDVLDGTSLRVSFQGIARRMRKAGKSDDEIAEAQVKFQPGKRAVGASTPVSRAKRAAKDAAEALGDQADAVTVLLEKIKDGKIDISSLV